MSENGNGQRGYYPLQPVGGGWHPGRPRGRPNQVTSVLRNAILLAAERVGRPAVRTDENGTVHLEPTGQDGLLGYLIHIALTDTRSFVSLLSRILPMKLDAQFLGVDPDKKIKTVEELRAELESRGLPAAFIELIAKKSEEGN